MRCSNSTGHGQGALASAGGARRKPSQAGSNIAERGYLRPSLTASRRAADRERRAAVTYDETWDDSPARRLPLAPVAVVLALAAVAASLYALYRESSVLRSER